MSAAELARKSGVSKQLISTWLAGGEPKKFAHVKRVSTVLGVSLDSLLYGKGADAEGKKAIELEALLGEAWVSGLFEIKIRRLRR